MQPPPVPSPFSSLSLSPSPQYPILKQQFQQLSFQHHSLSLQLQSLTSLLHSHSHKDRQNKQLKSSLADSKFQLKKIQQDIALQRTRAEMQRIKFLKGYDTKMQEMKEKGERDNSDWMARFDIREGEYRQEVKEIQEKWEQRLEEEKEKAHSELQAKILETQKKCSEHYAQLELDYMALQTNFRTQQQKLLAQSELRIKQEIKQITDKTNLQLQKKQKQYEIRLSIIENEKRQEVHQHENTKKQFVSVKDTLYQQIYQLTTHKDDLESQVTSFRTEIQQKTQRIISLNNSIKQLETKYETQINSYVQNSKKNLENIQTKTTGDIEQVLRNQLLYVETMEHKIKSLEDKHAQQLKEYRAQLDHIKHCYEQRPSKMQDVDSIRVLKEKLWKKEKEYEFLQDEIKWFRLEVSNKEDMYTKMFAGGGWTGELRSVTNQQQERGLTRSPVVSRGEYKAKRIGRSLMMKRKDDSKTSYGSFPNSRGGI